MLWIGEWSPSKNSGRIYNPRQHSQTARVMELFLTFVFSNLVQGEQSKLYLIWMRNIPYLLQTFLYLLNRIIVALQQEFPGFYLLRMICYEGVPVYPCKTLIALNRPSLQCGLNPSCKFFLTCLGYWPETFHTLIKLTPRVTLPQILGHWPIIQDLKNDPIFIWELLFGYKSVMVTPTNTLWGWFGGPPGVLQMTHPMGPSTDAYGYRRSKRAKTHSTSKPKMTLAEPNDWAQDAICCRFWTKNFFETLSRVGIS